MIIMRSFMITPEDMAVPMRRIRSRQYILSHAKGAKYPLSLPY